MKLLQDRDFETLKPMVAPRLLEYLQASYERSAHDKELEGLTWRWQLPDDFPAFVVDVRFWTPQRAAEWVPGRKGGLTWWSGWPGQALGLHRVCRHRRLGALLLLVSGAEGEAQGRGVLSRHACADAQA